MAVTTMAAFAVSASAIDFFPDAISVKSGKKVETTMSKSSEKVYKITLSKKGDLVIKLEHNVSDYIKVTLMDQDGGEINYTKKDSKAGYWSWGLICSDNGVFSGSITYTLTKGTYYLKIYCYAGGLVEFTPTYPSKAEQSVSYLSATLKKGSTLQLGAVLSDGKAGTAEWSSSKSSVAAVSSKGKITAKAKGTAVITAKVGSSTVKIQIKVTE